MFFASQPADVLSRFETLSLRGVFTGHYHARVERRKGDTPLLTNACCSRVRDNHDGTLEEGYLLCTAQPDGHLTWQFTEFVPARESSASVPTVTLGGQGRSPCAASCR